MTMSRRKLKPLKAFFVAFAAAVSLVFAASCVWGIVFFTKLWIYSEPDSTVGFDQGRYRILASANDAQRYDLYDQEAETILDDVQGYAKREGKGYVFNEDSLAVINENSGFIEIKPLAEADEEERRIMEKAQAIGKNRQS